MVNYLLVIIDFKMTPFLLWRNHVEGGIKLSCALAVLESQPIPNPRTKTKLLSPLLYAHTNTCIFMYMHTFTCTHISIFHTAIGVKDLAEKLDSVAVRWEDLGIQLDVDVNNIANPLTAGECFKQTLKVWLNSGNATREAVIDALETSIVGENALAHRLKDQGS